ncbi:MAG: transposase [Verrucomicrobia bacterium]|nr:transposase [Verrucomicrobiota bacterium]
MARKLRIQYAGALYHVINRGNYRADVFASEGAKTAFVGCLGEACEKTGWRVHAFVVMRNHYHLALETPRANLVEGMQWLQSTYANRFNRLRGEHGHVFQGRYHAIVVEDGAHLGAVAHYIHLNPVRAHIVSAREATDYRWSSLHLLRKRNARPSWLYLGEALDAAGGLPDTAGGHEAYLDFLVWLQEDEAAQKALAFDRMCTGWAMGSKEFKVALIDEHKEALSDLEMTEADVAEIREAAGEKALASCLERLGQSAAEAVKQPKAASWKVAIAAHLRAISTVKNPWLAERLHMGDPDGVSRYVSELRLGKRPEAAQLIGRISGIRV